MKLVFIIFVLIILASFITGVILTIREKKKNKTDKLTDDPRILFSVDDDKAVIIRDKMVETPENKESDRFEIASSDVVADSDDRFVVGSPDVTEDNVINEENKITEENNDDSEDKQEIAKSQTRFICNFDDEEII